MKFRILDTAVLNKDFPDLGLRSGDLGAVVQVYKEDGLEVEFVAASGRTEALVTLKESDIRSISDTDLEILIDHHITANIRRPSAETSRPHAACWQDLLPPLANDDFSAKDRIGQIHRL